MLYFTASVYDVRKNDVPVAVGAEKCFCRILPNGKCFHLQKSWGRGWIFIKCCPPHFVKKTTDYNCKRVKTINPLFCKNFSPFKSRSCVKTVKICSKGCFYKKVNVFICQLCTGCRQSGVTEKKCCRLKNSGQTNGVGCVKKISGVWEYIDNVFVPDFAFRQHVRHFSLNKLKFIVNKNSGFTVAPKKFLSLKHYF